MIKKILIAALLWPLVAFGQTFTYPSVTFQNLTVLGTCTGCAGSLGPQPSNTVLANVTGSSAPPAAFSMPGCSSTSSILQYTSNTGFTCNTTTWASPPSIGNTTPGSGAFTSLSASSTISGSGFSTYLASPPAIGGTAANAGTFTNLNSTSLAVTGSNPTLWFQASGTGAIGRHFDAKMGDVLSVKDFGATGNGTTDDTTAVQAAINYVCGSGKGYGGSGPALYFPGAAYLISAGSLTGFCNGFQMYGDGPIATRIYTNSTTGNLFSISTITGFGIRDLSITYKNTATSGYTIALNTGVYDVNINNVRIDGAFNAIGSLGTGVPQVFQNLDIENIANGGTGIYIAGGSDQYIHNVLIYSPSTSPRAGIEIVATGGVWMTNVDSVHNTRGLYIDPQSGQSVDWLFIMNSAFDTSLAHAIDIAPASGGSVYGSTFIGNWSSSSTDVGFYFEGAGTINGVRVDGHRSLNNGQDGMIIANGSNIQVSNSDFSGNSQSSSGTYNGITVAAGISNFMITGCRSGVFANFANTQNDGILVNTGSSNFYMITNNNATSNVHGDVQDNGTGASKVVNNNL